MWANVITLIRLLLTFVVVAWLVEGSAARLGSSVWLTIVVIWMDGLDGYVARKLNEASTFGAVWDILVDRIVEQMYWVTFAVLGWVALWVPLVVITRGVLVDGFRSVALKEGFTAFGDSSVMQHPVGVLLVSSRFSRWTYALAKALAFVLVIAVQWDVASPSVTLPAFIPTLAHSFVIITVVFCLLRGLPVLLACRRFMAT